MFSMCLSGSVVPSYEYIWGGFSSPRGIGASRVSSELEGDQERMLHLGGDLCGGDLLGGDFLGDLLRGDFLR